MASTVAAASTTSTVVTGGASATATAGVEAYEDMFKEITRKLYGEENANALHGTPIVQVATTGLTLPPDGERSFTTLLSDRAAGHSIEFAGDLNGNTSKYC